jgi:glycerol-3-phosphate acyltransferase PlsY
MGESVAAMACIAGHCWPVFFDFKGGKGVAVAGGIALYLDIRFFLACLGVFLIGALISKRVSVGSISACIAYPFLQLLMGERYIPHLLIGGLIFLVVIIQHRSNIKRLARNEEPEVKKNGTDQDDGEK